MRKNCFILAAFLAAGISFAAEPGPSQTFQMGKLLSPLSSVPMKTAEIVAYMPELKKLFVVGDEPIMEVVSLDKPDKPKVLGAMKLMGRGSSVSVFGDFVAVSEIADPEQDPGYVEIFQIVEDMPRKVGSYKVCAQPDMLTYTPNGKNILVACEGSPNKDMSVDPEGAIAILTPGRLNKKDSLLVKVSIVNFKKLKDSDLMDDGVRTIGTNPYAQTLEPEYITVSKDSKTAWVSLQENNAIAKINIPAKKVVGVFPLGSVDHSKPGFGVDVRKNGNIKIENVPVHGLRQPDGICYFEADGKPYIITANEGAESDDFNGWTDVTNALSLFERGRLDEDVFNGEALSALKTLKISNTDFCAEGQRKCPYVYSFGTRSISIFDGNTGELVWDSGDKIEQMLATVAPEYFNWNSKKDKVKMDARSDNKGCEPENVVVGMIGSHRLAFVGLERMSGVVVFNITNLDNPKIIDYYMDPKDRGPEGLLFIPEEQSPLPGKALLVVGYEYSKTLTIYTVK